MEYLLKPPRDSFPKDVLICCAIYITLTRNARPPVVRPLVSSKKDNYDIDWRNRPSLETLDNESRNMSLRRLGGTARLISSINGERDPAGGGLTRSEATPAERSWDRGEAEALPPSTRFPVWFVEVSGISPEAIEHEHLSEEVAFHPRTMTFRPLRITVCRIRRTNLPEMVNIHSGGQSVIGRKP